jgi:hypothetical protein
MIFWEFSAPSRGIPRSGRITGHAAPRLIKVSYMTFLRHPPLDLVVVSWYDNSQEKELKWSGTAASVPPISLKGNFGIKQREGYNGYKSFFKKHYSIVLIVGDYSFL